LVSIQLFEVRPVSRAIRCGRRDAADGGYVRVQFLPLGQGVRPLGRPLDAPQEDAAAAGRVTQDGPPLELERRDDHVGL
jgi:hypothetical protein